MDFGELVEPETRAFWENYDDFEEENREQVTLSWKWMDDDLSDQNEIKSFDSFYIIEGRQIFDFINSTILKSATPICQLENYKTAIYQLPACNYYICLTEGNDIDRTAQITELLKPWLEKARQTFAFSFQAAYSYNSSHEFDKRCFVRSIRSHDASALKLDFLEPMEDCNMIYGVAAGVSTWRLVNKLPFSCYAIYIDCPTVDSVVAPSILKLFNVLGLRSDATYHFRNINSSNLYI